MSEAPAVIWRFWDGETTEQKPTPPSDQFLPEYRRADLVDAEIERLRAEAEKYRDCLIWVQHRISVAKIWGGMDWHWNPLHPVHYLPAIERIDAALAGGEK